MTRFSLTLEYDGGPYMGLQRQPHGPTVQQHIETAVTAITGEPATFHAAGRTDSGVHALAMRAHIDVQKPLTAFRLMNAINAKLRFEQITVTDCVVVPDDWHARFSCIGREYVYHIINRRAKLCLDHGRAWHVTAPLDAQLMQQAANMLLGEHDFTTFRSIHCQSRSPVKTLNLLNVIRDGQRISIHAQARSFLHHQVRSMVGCLAWVGKGRWSLDDMRYALEACDRTKLAFNAPPQGLYFKHAVYPSDQARILERKDPR